MNYLFITESISKHLNQYWLKSILNPIESKESKSNRDVLNNTQPYLFSSNESVSSVSVS